MIGAEVAVSWSSLGPVFLLVAGSFFTVLLAENSRIPIDDPDTHLELTMIHEVMILDHSGPDLAYMLYAAAIKLFLFAGILIPIVLPVQTGHGAQDLFIFLAGMTGLSVVIGVVESCMARLRLNRVRHLLLSAFALAFFGLVVTLWKA
jgi:formate hydrogenlyase subunit 4